MHTNVAKDRPAGGVRIGVTSDNWIDAPFNRYGFWRVREYARTARVARGRGDIWRLPGRHRDLTGFTTAWNGQAFSLAEWLHATYTDAFVLVHRGEVVAEWYEDGGSADRTHLLMSVSKSLTATLVGALVAEGLLVTEAPVADYLPVLQGTAWDGATVQHLLDMQAGVRFSEHDMDDPECDGRLIEQISGYTTHRRPDLAPDTSRWILDLPSQHDHGNRYEYRSIQTDVLGWIVEEVTGQRFADAFSQRVWSRLGVEHDAELIVDSAGFPVVEGGFCVTTRDLARVGLMHLGRGMARGAAIVPSAWTDRVVDRDQHLIDLFAAGYDCDPGNPEAYYHDCWWVIDASLGRYTGLGLNGQHLLIDRSTETVMVKLSSSPHRIDPQLFAFTATAQLDLLTFLDQQPG